MSTNIVLDDDLVAEASRLSGITTKKDLVHEALRCSLPPRSERTSSISGARSNSRRTPITERCASGIRDRRRLVGSDRIFTRASKSRGGVFGDRA
ncbi:MAG TPA: type II toxin-antitoxin system VapB family antitoxin [Thermoanaerobaculia bacterium]|nr:type II toxin-antitoxin system VapB family antitoxin [Thermoanaerobaculia bacterium]